MKRPRTPEELSKKQGKKKISLTLDVGRLEQVQDVAAKAGVSASAIVDEAIAWYLKTIREGGRKKD